MARRASVLMNKNIHVIQDAALWQSFGATLSTTVEISKCALFNRMKNRTGSVEQASPLDGKHDNLRWTYLQLDTHTMLKNNAPNPVKAELRLAFGGMALGT